ncbi:hypothetical protein AAEX28_13845 [Lentisphaerota bacterium WC36G]|nr:hypothetical protein LJT99_00595 [Lentisphaerae bacterium WC36]
MDEKSLNKKFVNILFKIRAKNIKIKNDFIHEIQEIDVKIDWYELPNDLDE